MRCLPPFGLRVSESCHFKRADESPFAMEQNVKMQNKTKNPKGGRQSAMRCLPPFGLRVSESCHFKRADESPFAMEQNVKMIWMGLLLAQTFYTS